MLYLKIISNVTSRLIVLFSSSRKETNCSI